MAPIVSSSHIGHAVEILRQGGLVAFPTETVYGLGADGTNEQAVLRIYQAKGRPSSNPLILHVPSHTELLRWCAFERSVNPEQLRRHLMNLAPLWPGPLSVVVPRPDGVADAVCGGGESIALRIPNHPLALELLERFGKPVAAPSANISNYVSPTTAQHVQEGLGAKVDLILDGGPCVVGLESTVLSLVHDSPSILRPGAVTREVLEAHLGEHVNIENPPVKSDSPLLSPGLLAKHYSPMTPVLLITEISINQPLPNRIGAIRFTADPPPFNTVEVRYLSKDFNLPQIAEHLFASLRELDSLGLDLIVVDVCEPVGMGAAIMDRLVRASAKTA